MGTIAELFEELGDLLARYGYDRHAKYARELRKLYLEEPSKFAEEIRNRRMWGGAGSVTDAAPKGGTYEDVHQANADQKRFVRIVIKLVEELETQGIASDDALSVARVLRTLDED